MANTSKPTKKPARTVKKANTWLYKQRSSKRAKIASLFIVIFAAIGAYFLIQSHAATIAPTGTYTDWTWPARADGYTGFEWGVTPEYDPTPAGYYYAHDFEFKNNPDTSKRGYAYAGLQTTNNGFGGRKIAIFSIFYGLNAVPGPTAKLVTGTELGAGTVSLRTAYDWHVGITYNFRIAKTSGPSSNNWWGVWVQDGSTGQETYLGAIETPLSWGNFAEETGNWSENYGQLNSPLASCDQLVKSIVRFSTPTANNKTVKPLSHKNHLYGGGVACPGSTVFDVPTGVRQKMAKDWTPPALPDCDGSWRTIPGNGLGSFNVSSIYMSPNSNSQYTNSVVVIVRGTDNRLYAQPYNFTTGWRSSWEAINNMQSVGTFYIWKVQGLDVLAIGLDGKPYHNANISSGWLGWGSFNTPNEQQYFHTSTSSPGYDWDTQIASGGIIQYKCSPKPYTIK